MSDLKLLPNQRTSEELLERLVDSLPTAFPKDEEKNNYAVYGPVANYQSRFIEDTHNVREAKEVENAATFDQLTELAKFVGVSPRTGEGIEKYRLRVLSTFQNITSEGTPKDILNNAGYILGVSSENIDYSESNTPGLIVLGFPKAAVDNSELTTTQIVTLLDQNVAAGYNIKAIITGTLEFLSPQDYNNGLSDPSSGYDGLDVNGNPKGNGGTYPTVLE